MGIAAVTVAVPNKVDERYPADRPALCVELVTGKHKVLTIQTGTVLNCQTLGLPADASPVVGAADAGIFKNESVAREIVRGLAEIGIAAIRRRALGDKDAFRFDQIGIDQIAVRIG